MDKREIACPTCPVASLTRISSESHLGYTFQNTLLLIKLVMSYMQHAINYMRKCIGTNWSLSQPKFYFTFYKVHHKTLTVKGNFSEKYKHDSKLEDTYSVTTEFSSKGKWLTWNTTYESSSSRVLWRHVTDLSKLMHNYWPKCSPVRS